MVDRIEQCFDPHLDLAHVLERGGGGVGGGTRARTESAGSEDGVRA